MKYRKSEFEKTNGGSDKKSETRKLKQGNTKKQLGAQGERESVKLLEKRGLEILRQNFRTREGEIDIIARDGSDIVFIEVKTRKSLSAGRPEEAIDAGKQEKIRRIAEKYLADRGMMEHPVRFDVITFEWNVQTKRWNARWIKKAF